MVDGDISLFDHVDALPALGGLVGGDLGGPLLGHADNPLPDSWLLVLFTEGESDQPVDQLVESPYVHHDSRNENDHDACVSHQLMLRRTNDLAELVEDLTDKQGDRLEEPGDRPEESTHRVAPLGGITACATGASGACRTRHAHSSSSLTLSGGTHAPQHVSRHCGHLCRIKRSVATCFAGQEGLEPPTAGFGDRCSTN